MTKDFGAFPPDKYLPKSVRAAIDKYLDLREHYQDAQEDVVALRAKIGEAETADIMAAANAYVAGKEETTTGHYDAAVKAVKDAERRQRVLKAAMPQVTAELQAAFAAAGDDIRATADAEFESATAAYIQAVEALVLARTEWLVSVAAKRYAGQATQGAGGEANYIQPNPDAAEYKRFRDEVASDPAALFAPPAHTGQVVHHAHHVQGLLHGRQIPSFARGNRIIVLEGDRDAASEAITALSDWYEDGDGVTRDYAAPQHITVETVPAMTDGMRMQCHWLRSATRR
jgi:hypothetical protein